MQIEISSEVAAALQLAVRASGKTIDTILKELMGFSMKAEAVASSNSARATEEKGEGLVCQDGTYLPYGLKIRGKHKGEYFPGIVLKGEIKLDKPAGNSKATSFKNPSPAAKAIKGYDENGWRWFEGQAEDGEWRLLESWRKRR